MRLQKEDSQHRSHTAALGISIGFRILLYRHGGKAYSMVASKFQDLDRLSPG
jgi:hypothetical protein